MGDVEDDGASTGFSPHRKQPRPERSNRVITRGRVPVLSPEPPAAAAASCSPAGSVEQRQRGVDDEVRRVFCDRSA